jgi:arylsulfatase A-like enzyme
MANQPNILIIMTDQQRADVCAREGFPLDTTPFLDGLARQGTWFDKAYTAAPLCVPARTSMLTGRFPSAHRVRDNYASAHVIYDKDLFDVAKAQGYATALVGKNHSYVAPTKKTDFSWICGHFGSSESDRTEREVEFDKWLAGNSQVELAPTPHPLELQLPARAVSSAIRWIDSQRDQPFLMWLSFAEPHNPYQVPEPYFSLFPPEQLPPLRAGNAERDAKGFKWRWSRQLGERFAPNYEELIPRARSNYFGMLRLIDDQIKRLIDHLQASSLLDNTLIVFLSDHGDFVGEYGLIKKGPELPDILLRIPLFFYGPGLGIQASSKPHPAHVSIVDLLPTVCEALGAALPDGVQGRSLWPLLRGEAYPEDEFSSIYGEFGVGGRNYTDSDELDYHRWGSVNEQGVIRYDELNTYSQTGIMRTVRRGEWKLNLDQHGKGELYRIAEDPLELHNLYGRPEYAQTERDMLAELAAWMIRMQDPLPVPREYAIKKDPHNYWSPYNNPTK